MATIVSTAVPESGMRPNSRPDTHFQGSDDHIFQNSRFLHHDFSGSSSRLNTPTGATSGRASSQGFNLPGAGSSKYFHSRRIDKSEIPKPWTAKKDSSRIWNKLFPTIGIIVGLGLAALQCWQGYLSVVNKAYCPVYMEDFSSGALDMDIWTKEVEVGGFGNGQFEMTTSTNENVFIRDGELWIQPTLQDATLIENNGFLNLSAQGICTGTGWANCHAITNTTNGTIINPVKSGRINTKRGATIQYGRVEVEAMLPQGDWMWPAIWMLPVNNVYGEWPASGEIDIAESRGNNYTYKYGGNEVVSCALHWGPQPGQDAWYRTYEKKDALHTTYSDTWHTFGLEWSEKYLFTYINKRLIEALYVPFTSPRWPQGGFDGTNENGTAFVDPWSQTGRSSTPFDQSFYLILDVAVGATNSWWKDGYAGKPWVDSSPTAPFDFWQARDEWYPTWKEKGQMRVKSVKIWQEEGYRGCTNGKIGY